MTWRSVALFLAIAILLAWRAACDAPVPREADPPETGSVSPERPFSEPIAEGSYQVARVVDGDTLVLAGGRRLRLIGVNAPESVKPDWPVEPWGPEAADFTRQFLADKKVRLQFDLERVDQYDRLLGYVWVGDRMLNEELLRAGLARATLQYRFSETMKRRFRAAQDESRQARRGIWSQASGNDTSRKTPAKSSPAKSRQATPTR